MNRRAEAKPRKPGPILAPTRWNADMFRMMGLSATHATDLAHWLHSYAAWTRAMDRRAPAKPETRGKKK